MFKNISVLGAGSWGLAIAQLLRNNGAFVRLWEFNKSDWQIIHSQRCHPKKLPGILLSKDILVFNDLKSALVDADLVVLAVPSQVLRSVLINVREVGFGIANFVNLAKGIENNSLQRMSEVIHGELSIPHSRIATLSGPSHAEEVSAEMPTTVVVASEISNFCEMLQSTFSNRTFRVYGSLDLVGVELGGSLKNIIAIAAGICSGLMMGDNTMGALLTRGLAEITRLGIVLNAKPETFAGLSGIGDLITTCLSKHSRNRHVGERIGQGEKLDKILSSMAMVAEGVQTTKSGMALATKWGVEMPITHQVNEVLFNDKFPKDAIMELMVRDLKFEHYP